MARTLKPEDRISHYQVVGHLGASGMGEVYRAHDQSLERDVALKVLPPELVTSEERVRRFTLEAKSASSLNHPHIVHIYEIGEDRVRGDGAPEPSTASLHYIAMELVTGTTLAAKIHEKKADVKSLLGWLAQAAEGVAKAHAAGIVHRDLKPGNVMVSSDGYAKVLDFGLAKLTERGLTDSELSAAPTMTARDQTSEGAVLGTVGYMAPEQVRGQAVDARADVFAFGCMLYEAATRRRPFAAASKVETMHRILHDVPAPVEELNPEAPAELRRLIRRCLAKDPNQRVQSMKDVALELREIVAEYEELSASNYSRATRPGAAVPLPLSHGRRGVMITAGLVIALAAAVALWPRGPSVNPDMRTRNPSPRSIAFSTVVMAIAFAIVLCPPASSDSLKGKIKKGVYHAPAELFSLPVPKGDGSGWSKFVGVHTSESHAPDSTMGVLSFADDFGRVFGIAYFRAHPKSLPVLADTTQTFALIEEWIRLFALPNFFYAASTESRVVRVDEIRFADAPAALALVNVPGGR